MALCWPQFWGRRQRVWRRLRGYNIVTSSTSHSEPLWRRLMQPSPATTTTTIDEKKRQKMRKSTVVQCDNVAHNMLICCLLRALALCNAYESHYRELCYANCVVRIGYKQHNQQRRQTPTNAPGDRLSEWWPAHDTQFGQCRFNCACTADN